MSLFSVELFEDGQSIGIEFATSEFDARHIKMVHTAADPAESHAVIEDITTFNEDWLGWPDAPGGEEYEAGYGAQVDADLDAQLQYSEDVDFAQTQMVYECAEASWYRFMVA